MQTSVTSIWFEPLPHQCPPADATPPNGVFYRLAKAAPAICEDFWSARKLQPAGIFQASECIAMAISVYSDQTSLRDLQKLPRHRQKIVVAVSLRGTAAGLIKKTGRDKYHHSWWRPADFPVLANLRDVAK